MAIARMIQYLSTSNYDDENTYILKNLQSSVQPLKVNRPVLMAKAAPCLLDLQLDGSDEKSSMQLVNHAKVYVLCEVYMIEDLKKLAFLKFKHCVMDHACSGDFVEAIKIIYHIPPATDEEMYTLLSRLHPTMEPLCLPEMISRP